jgi:Na+/H+ antiporter NhaC
MSILLAGVAYVVIGMGTATLAAHAASPTGVTRWRLAAFLLSFVVFGIHFLVERKRHRHRRTSAMTLALGVALGALGVAAFGPMRAHWADPSRLKLVMLSLIAWPILTGVPAFVVALIGGLVADRLLARRHRTHSPAA